MHKWLVKEGLSEDKRLREPEYWEIVGKERFRQQGAQAERPRSGKTSLWLEWNE